MPDYSTNDVVLVRYPFSDLSAFKVRPAIIVSAPHISQDVFIVPLTSKITNLLPSESVVETSYAIRIFSLLTTRQEQTILIPKYNLQERAYSCQQLP